MSQPDDTQWLLERIEKTKLMIVAYEDAITALSGGAQSYNLNTGQTQQMVTRANLATMRDTLSSLENRKSTLECRLYGSGAIHVRPAF
jgi:hypothetical protein